LMIGSHFCARMSKLSGGRNASPGASSRWHWGLWAASMPSNQAHTRSRQRNPRAA
jgi:hypothetical protein